MFEIFSGCNRYEKIRTLISTLLTKISTLTPKKIFFRFSLCTFTQYFIYLVKGWPNFGQRLIFDMTEIWSETVLYNEEHEYMEKNVFENHQKYHFGSSWPFSSWHFSYIVTLVPENLNIVPRKIRYEHWIINGAFRGGRNKNWTQVSVDSSARQRWGWSSC